MIKLLYFPKINLIINSLADMNHHEFRKRHKTNFIIQQSNN